MARASQRIGLALILLAAVADRPTRADLIVAGDTTVTGTAIMDLTLLAGTPFNPGATPIVLTGVAGTGALTLHRDAEVGDTILIPSFSGGMFYGSNAALGSYVFGNIAPMTGADFQGKIANVVQNPNDPGFATGQASSFQSGDFSFGGKSFGFLFLSGPAAGIKLFTDPAVPFSFAARFDGLPPSSGTVLRNSGPDALNVLFNGQLVARSSNRTIVLSAVPEPGSLALCGVGGLVLVGSRRRRRRGKAV